MKKETQTIEFITTPGTVLTSVCDSFFLVSSRETLKVNEMVAFLWSYLEWGATIQFLTDAVKKNYETDDSSCVEKDIRSLISFLQSKHFLQRYKK